MDIQRPGIGQLGVDIFDRLTNAKRQAKAALSQSQAYSQAVQTQLIANIANLYYTLLMLDRQYEITTETAVKWLESFVPPKH